MLEQHVYLRFLDASTEASLDAATTVAIADLRVVDLAAATLCSTFAWHCVGFPLSMLLL